MILTTHESEQQAELRKPLWPIYSTFPHCSGPCNQGRSVCMTQEACQTGQADADDMPPRPPMLRHDPLFLLLAAIFSVGAVWLLAMGAMPYVLAFGRWLQSFGA